MHRALSILLLVSLGIGMAYAQPNGKLNLGLNVPDDFLSLADLRGQLNGEIPILEKGIKDLEERIPKTQADEEELTRLRVEASKKKPESEVKDAKRDRSIFAILSGQLREESKILSLERSLKESGGSVQLVKMLSDKRNELASKRELAKAVQKKLLTLIGPEQQYKRDLSIAFTVLIGLVIALFFIVVIKDHEVRRKIFSGQVGIQFLTLFSLVIAIILFGMTGVLEGKELAALLGGISGYILGKVA